MHRLLLLPCFSSLRWVGMAPTDGHDWVRPRRAGPECGGKASAEQRRGGRGSGVRRPVNLYQTGPYTIQFLQICSF